MPAPKPTLDYGRPEKRRYSWWGIAGLILFAVLTLGTLGFTILLVLVYTDKLSLVGVALPMH